MRNEVPRLSALLLPVALFGPVQADTAAVTRPPIRLTDGPAPLPGSLAGEILRMDAEDQAILTDLARARTETLFRDEYRRRVATFSAVPRTRNFYDPMLYAAWARERDAPALVRRYVMVRGTIDRRIREIVERYGWPDRKDVGDEAAARFFFLFGHADDLNAWRIAQLRALDRALREDHLSPRLYAHLVDRIANLADAPQLYGTIMGPGPTAGSAKLYWPLAATVANADRLRASIGLPALETDLRAFRDGAELGPYMIPLAKGANWTIADVFPGAAP